MNTIKDRVLVTENLTWPDNTESVVLVQYPSQNMYDVDIIMRLPDGEFWVEPYATSKEVFDDFKAQCEKRLKGTEYPPAVGGDNDITQWTFQ